MGAHKIIAAATSINDLARPEVAEVVRGYSSEQGAIDALSAGDPRALGTLRDWLRAQLRETERNTDSYSRMSMTAHLLSETRRFYQERYAENRAVASDIEQAMLRLDELARDSGLVLWAHRLCRPTRVRGRFAHVYPENVILVRVDMKGILSSYEEVEEYVCDSVSATWERLTGERM